jgi:hypothetical protein
MDNSFKYRLIKQLKDIEGNPYTIWWLWILFGVALLVVDMWDSIILIRTIPCALQRSEIMAMDLIMSILAACALTSSQIWLFSLILKHEKSKLASNWIVVVFLVIPGVILNVGANFFVFVGGKPSSKMISILTNSFEKNLSTTVGQFTLVFAGVLAIIVSFFPEFLIARGMRDRKLKDIIKESKQASDIMEG